MPYGRVVLGTTGYPIFALASDPKEADWKVGGVTIDWNTVTAVGADTLLPDGTTIKSGQKFLRWGQVIARAGTAEVQTVTFTGGPTGGGAILEVPAVGVYPLYDTPSIPFNASGSDVQNALAAAPAIGIDGVSVVRSGTGIAGDPYVYTLTYSKALGNVPQLTSPSNTFAGGTTPSVTIATTTAGTGTGLWGPYDPGAGDGRQLLVRGDCFVVNELWTQNPTVGFGQPNADNPGCFDGGTVWKDRIVTSGAAAHSLALGPTLVEFEAAFPRIGYAQS